MPFTIPHQQHVSVLHLHIYEHWSPSPLPDCLPSNLYTDKSSSVPPTMRTFSLCQPLSFSNSLPLMAPSPLDRRRANGPMYPQPKGLSLEGIQGLRGCNYSGCQGGIRCNRDPGRSRISPAPIPQSTNKQTDKYGGSFDNQVKLILEVVDVMRRVIPAETSLFLRCRVCRVQVS
ncbi:hypothetical protein BDN72DRAFT_851907 [Pluteus cervinus]|uniref:Uncharacterized protein n=1 Tax=Pluteus cervinus TaxID=181527 RepID=A0ACD2ZWY7_9AGAR|nr:hypothetical protein BDN72DRAFT_851907 [Pluteus cervinus]